MPTNKELQEQVKELRQERDEWKGKAEAANGGDQDEKPMNIHQKIVVIRSVVENITKDSQGSAGKGHTFKYASTNSLLKEIKSKMDELGVILYPEIPNGLAHETYTYKTNSGERTDFIVDGIVNYVWQNADNPDDKLVVPWYVKGQQNDISKAFGSGMTYAERYFIFKFLNIPTDEDDPDNTENQKGQQQRRPQGQQNNQQRQPQNNQRSGAALILDKIDELVKAAGATKSDVQNRLAQELGYDPKKRFKEMDEALQQKIVGQLKTWIGQYKNGGNQS